MQPFFLGSFEGFSTLSIYHGPELGLCVFRRLHMLTGGRTKHSENIAISLNLNLTCTRRHAKRRYAIYCFANFLLCFRSSLAVDEPAQDGDVEACRAIFHPFWPAKAPCTLPDPWRPSDDVLKNLWKRCDSGTTSQRLRSISSAVGRQQAPWWLSESKLAKLVASTKDIEPVPELDFEFSLLFFPNRVRPKVVRGVWRERRREARGRAEAGC